MNKKIKNMNNLVEKISEIGVKKIVPMLSEFSSRIQININRPIIGVLFQKFDTTNSSLQLVERLTWLPSIGFCLLYTSDAADE